MDISKIRGLMAAIVCAAGILTAGNAAQGATITYSFSNDPAWGNVAGTVTGHIDGLNPNGTSAATAVWVDSYPAGLVMFGTYTTPFDVLSWIGGSVSENTFTLVGGSFVDGHFSESGANGVNDQLYLNSFCACASFPTNFIDIGSNDTRYVWNSGVVGVGIVFGNGIAGVPEPATLALFGAGLAGLGAMRRRRKTKS